MTAACRSAPFTVITAGISSIRWRSATLFWGCKTSCARFMWRSWSATTSWRPCEIIRPVRRWWPPQRRACRRAHVCVQRDEDSKGGAAFGMRGFLGDRCLVCGEAVGSLSAGFGALRRAGHGAAAGSAAVCFAAGGWGERACSRFFGARQRDRRKAAGKPAGSLPFYIAASMTRCILPCFWRGGSPLRRRMANARSQPLPRGSSGAARTCWGRNWR